MYTRHSGSKTEGPGEGQAGHMLGWRLSYVGASLLDASLLQRCQGMVRGQGRRAGWRARPPRLEGSLGAGRHRQRRCCVAGWEQQMPATAAQLLRTLSPGSPPPAHAEKTSRLVGHQQLLDHTRRKKRSGGASLGTIAQPQVGGMPRQLPLLLNTHPCPSSSTSTLPPAPPPTSSKSSTSSSRRKRFQPPAITQISGSLHPCASSRSASLHARRGWSWVGAGRR